jgi:hypothetical protein
MLGTGTDKRPVADRHDDRDSGADQDLHDRTTGSAVPHQLEHLLLDSFARSAVR